MKMDMQGIEHIEHYFRFFYEQLFKIHVQPVYPYVICRLG